MDRLFRSSQTDSTGADHAENSVRLPEDAIVDVIEAEYLEGYKLRISFSDGMTQTVDFEPFLRSSLNPLIRKYLDPDLFRQFTVEYGDLLWNDYDLCFPVADLYENRLR